MLCKECGSNLSNDASFCSDCGAKIGGLRRLVRLDAVQAILIAIILFVLDSLIAHPLLII
jgi:uncharacterized membrane protein YvbJ